MESTGVSNKVAGVYVTKREYIIVERGRENSQIYEMIPTCRLYLIREHATGDRIPRERRRIRRYF